MISDKGKNVVAMLTPVSLLAFLSGGVIVVYNAKAAIGEDEKAKKMMKIGTVLGFGGAIAFIVIGSLVGSGKK